MKKAITSFLIIFTFAFLLAACSKTPIIENKSSVSNDITLKTDVLVDKDFLLALNAGNQFLGAWLMRDQQKGSEFITVELRNKLGDEGLFIFFVGTSNPHHQGFEIIGRERVNDTTIRFNVWLYEYYTGDNPAPYKRNNPSYIDVVKFDEYRWLVNTLPIQL